MSLRGVAVGAGSAGSFRNSEHASTARPKGVMKLGRVGVCAGYSAPPFKMTRDIIPLVTAYQRKTGIYNTLDRLGQTGKCDCRLLNSHNGQIIDFAGSMLDLAIVKIEIRDRVATNVKRDCSGRRIR